MTAYGVLDRMGDWTLWNKIQWKLMEIQIFSQYFAFYIVV